MLMNRIFNRRVTLKCSSCFSWVSSLSMLHACCWPHLRSSGCLRRFLIFSIVSEFVFKSVIIAFCQSFLSLNWYISQLFTCENEHQFCLFGRFSSKITRGPTRFENDRHLCVWNKRIRRDSFRPKLSSQNTVFCILRCSRKLKSER